MKTPFVCILLSFVLVGYGSANRSVTRGGLRGQRVEERLLQALDGREETFQYDRVRWRLLARDRLLDFIRDQRGRTDETARLMVRQAEGDLEELDRYFAEELECWRMYPSAPGVKPRVLDFAEFGEVGDGKTDSAPAFARAFAAVRALKGAPSILRIPSGRYLVRGNFEIPGFRLFNLDASSLTNCIIEGASPESVEIIFGTYDASGISLMGCKNTTLRNVHLYYDETPFSQGTVLAFDKTNRWAIIRHEPGTLKPTDSRFRKGVQDTQCCGQFDEKGRRLYGSANVFFDLRAEDLGDDLYRIHFADHPSYPHVQIPVGSTLVLPDRNNRYQAVRATGARLCNFENVWITNSRSGAFTVSGGWMITGWKCRVFPHSPNLVLSTNADAFFNSRGTHLAHCDFHHMNDDGANSHATGKMVKSISEDRRTIIHAPCSPRRNRGDRVVLLRPMDGRLLGVFEIASAGKVRVDGSWYDSTTFTERVPDDLKPMDELGMGELTSQERSQITRGFKKLDRHPDQIYFPMADGVGYVVFDNDFHDNRNLAIQIQCPNAIVVSNRISRVSGAIAMSCLTDWMEGPAPYNVLIRGNEISEVSSCVRTIFTLADGGASKETPFRGIEVVDNVMTNLPSVRRVISLRNATAAVVVGNRIDPRASFLEKSDLSERPENPRTKGKYEIRNWTRQTNPLFSLDVEGVDDIHLAYVDERAPTLILSNRTERSLSLRGKVEVAACDGETFDLGVSGTLDAYVCRHLEFGRPLRKGLWKAVAALETPDAKAVAETRFAVVQRRSVAPPLPPGAFRVGLNYHMSRYTDSDNEKCLRSLVQAGAKIVRASIFASFGNVQKEQGVYDWTRADGYLAKLEQAGLALDTIIYGAPCWSMDEKHAKSPYWQSPMKRGLFRDFCEKLSARYGTRIAWYEIGNEWDLAAPEQMTADEAIEMQREGYEGIKAGCPSAKVIPNGWAVVHSDVIPHRTQRDMQERMMTEAVGFYDAHPVHQHGPYHEYRRRLAEFFAWRKAKGIIHKPWYSNETAQTTGNVVEERVAECVWQKILHAWAHGSVDYIWYNLRAIGYGPYDGEQGYGVMTGDFYPRATYAAFAGLTSCFEGLKADGIVHEGESRDLYRFAGNGRTVLVGWDLRAKASSVIRVRTDAKRAFAADLYDNRTEVPVADGEVVFTIGRTPAALILEGATSAVPDGEDLRRGERKEVLDIVLDGKGHHFTLHDYDGVFEMYKADPANFDKVWKGWWDLIADIDISVVDGRLKIRAKTNDEKLAADDALVVSVDGKEIRFPVAEPHEKGAIYRGDVPCPSADSIVEIRIEDDDGLGKEGWITTGRFRIKPDAREEEI